MATPYHKSAVAKAAAKATAAAKKKHIVMPAAKSVAMVDIPRIEPIQTCRFILYTTDPISDDLDQLIQGLDVDMVSGRVRLEVMRDTEGRADAAMDHITQHGLSDLIVLSTDQNEKPAGRCMKISKLTARSVGILYESSSSGVQRFTAELHSDDIRLLEDEEAVKVILLDKKLKGAKK